MSHVSFTHSEGEGVCFGVSMRSQTILRCDQTIFLRPSSSGVTLTLLDRRWNRDKSHNKGLRIPGDSEVTGFRFTYFIEHIAVLGST